jgi:hypothetical protein
MHRFAGRRPSRRLSVNDSSTYYLAHHNSVSLAHFQNLKNILLLATLLLVTITGSLATDKAIVVDNKEDVGTDARAQNLRGNAANEEHRELSWWGDSCYGYRYAHCGFSWYGCPSGCPSRCCW